MKTIVLSSVREVWGEGHEWEAMGSADVQANKQIQTETMSKGVCSHS